MITGAGNHPNPKVAGLAYIDAFPPDKGESVAALNKASAPGAPVSPILPPQDGYVFKDKAKFPRLFRGRRGRSKGSVLGRFASSVGRGGSQWHNSRTGVEDQA